MAIINGVDTTSLGVTDNTTQKARKTSLDQTDFFRLMLTQLKQQDPLKPQDNTQFVAQMAQMSSLEGMNKLNDNFTSFMNSFQSNQALQASALVGRSVEVDAEVGLFTGTDPFKGTITLPARTSNVNVSIYDGNGQLVREIPMGSYDQGDLPFLWDGIASNGQGVEPGIYKVVAKGEIYGEQTQLSTTLSARVDSVTLSQSGGAVLNLFGYGPVTMDQVKKIN